jgi:RNA polymerase sigma factor for flagellar operon FliA
MQRPFLVQPHEYEIYAPLVRRIAHRMIRRLPRHHSAHDLMSSGWVGLLQARRRARPDMTEEEFLAYASHRVRGAILDHLREADTGARGSDLPRVVRDDVECDALPSDRESAEEQLERAEAAASVDRCVERLPERLRRVVALYYEESCTLQQIGAILGVTEGRACQIRSEAVAELRGMMCG